MVVKQGKDFALCSKPELAQLFPAFIDGDLDPTHRESIEEHLATCVSCQDELKLFLDLQELGKTLSCEE